MQAVARAEAEAEKLRAELERQRSENKRIMLASESSSRACTIQ